MPYNARIVSTYFKNCGIATYADGVATALENFTGEIDSTAVAAIIDKYESPSNYLHNPVDLTIEKGGSWKKGIQDIIIRASERKDPTLALLMHEYDLWSMDNCVAMLKAFQDNDITALTYLHTILEKPDDDQRETLQKLAEYSDSLIVHTHRGVNTLKSDTYGIDELKLKHISHGVRLCSSRFDRQAVKEEYDLKDKFLATTLGLRGPDKGLKFGIGAYAKFIKERLSLSQRKRMVYLIAGGCHPNFIAHEGGAPYEEYEYSLQKAFSDWKLNSVTLSDSKHFPDDIKSKPVRDFRKLDFGEYDVVLLDSFLEEEMLMKLYTATNVMLLPYLKLQQAVSGILTDTFGSGRVAIATKFDHACEALNPLDNPDIPYNKGPWGFDRSDARGIMTDSGEDFIDQGAWMLDHLLIDGNGDGKRRGKDWRLKIEDNAFEYGYSMRWNNVIWQMLNHAHNIYLKKHRETGRGPVFMREIQRPAD